jgi:hypothetical protein
MQARLETPGSSSSVGTIDKLFRRIPPQILNERKNFHEFHESLDENAERANAYLVEAKIW